MKIFLMSLFTLLSAANQSEPFEKRAISAAQLIPASRLDAKLPDRSFGEWLNDAVGREAGIIWQLAECGAAVAADGNGREVSACAEATALLANGDKVIVGISVGTFKKGLIGEPVFMGAVIDRGERLYKIRRLSDLPGILRPSSKGRSHLPDLQADLMRAVMLSFTIHTPIHGESENHPSPRFLAMDEDTAPPPPAPRQNSGDLVGASVISSVKPAYPPAAKNMRLSGNVEVRVVISETGRVVEAKAVKGPMMLQGAAVTAARQWVYKPATRNGVPVKTESVITFTFGPDN